MPPKAKIAAPIDRPLSKAYVREFTGWATAEPPGVSDPTSLRIMENVMVNRDGSLRVRPGLRYLSYQLAPSDPALGTCIDEVPVGAHEVFFLNDGSKAYLFAVREDDDTVGFRVLVFSELGTTVKTLTAAGVDFDVVGGASEVNFTAATTYVKYLQIDNKIFALSNAGEPMRMFYVGSSKIAKALHSLVRPEWTVADKLSVVHPNENWVTTGMPTGTRYNRVINPSFETNAAYWTFSAATDPTRMSSGPTPVAGSHTLMLESLPERTNLCPAPLHDVATYGVTGWAASDNGSVFANGSEMRVGIDPGVGGRTVYVRTARMPCKAKELYRAALDVTEILSPVESIGVMFRFFGSTGTQVGSDVHMPLTRATGRRVTGSVEAPAGAVEFQAFPKATMNNNPYASSWSFKNVVFARAAEASSIFHGSSGADYFWTGATNASASVYHPPAVVTASTEVFAESGGVSCSSIYVRAATAAKNFTLTAKFRGAGNAVLSTASSGIVADATGSWTRLSAGEPGAPAGTTRAEIVLTSEPLARGDRHYIDAAMFEPDTYFPDTYFDGATTDTSTIHRSWLGATNAAVSREDTYSIGGTIPPAETKTADTLISSTRADNAYNFGFFYTFSNEVGESAASRVTVVRGQRPWSGWAWETPNAAGEPSGTDTADPTQAADQLVAYMPQEVFDDAIAQGATSWSLYMFTWSDQEPAPVMAVKVDERALDATSTRGAHGWLRATPASSEAGASIAALPTRANRYNYSDPSRGSQGLVAADRMILVGDPSASAVIRWTSNQQGEYSNFTAAKGGGYKTLTSGNLYVPVCVKLWQNPQSADTLTILCLGVDGQSTSYYMAPAQVASQSESLNVMGFEETTATPGTTSPFGVEVFNNSLYHPIEEQLMKSTASNYNINHKSQTDLIRNVWEKLATKQKIISSQHDGRLYYIVHNPDGEALLPNCNGNELWVMDAQSKSGTWSRFLIQASSLRKIEYGGQVYMSVVRPDGIYYLDPDYGLDDVVVDGEISTTAIPWRIESNTQGANRAHDAWCHLQQLSVQLGYFQGRMRFGLRSVDINGKAIDRSKIVRDKDAALELAWDIEENLSVRRDLKEWFFYAESIFDEDGAVEPSFGQISLVQFRYTPVSVNVGYEHGSIETFEYGRDVAETESSNTVNGVPVPLLDSRRP